MKLRKRLWVLAAFTIAASGLTACGQSADDQDASDSGYEDSLNSIAPEDVTVGITDQFSGVVISDVGQDVTKDDQRTIESVLVEAGDPVHIGTPLFRYDTEDLALKLALAELELTGIQNRIATLRSQLDTLTKERDKAKEEDKLSYTLQIQETELNIRTEEYNTTVKEQDIERTKKSMENTEVLSEIEGFVKAVNESGYDSMGQPLPYIQLAASGNYRIKGRINEMNMNQLTIGTPVTVISRADPTLTWSGVIETVDFNTPETDTGGNMWGIAKDELQTSSNYSFYVTIDDMTGLILGQHVYIKPSSSPEDFMGGEVMP